MVEKLKSILAVQEGTEQAEGSECEPATLFKCLEEERIEQENWRCNVMNKEIGGAML